jgi:hypothetical protein
VRAHHEDQRERGIAGERHEVPGRIPDDAGGGVPAVAIPHASFNAWGQITAVHGWWPSYVALIVLLALTVVWRGRTRPQARLEERG